MQEAKRAAEYTVNSLPQAKRVADNDALCNLPLVTPIWGEDDAGDEWEAYSTRNHTVNQKIQPDPTVANPTLNKRLKSRLCLDGAQQMRADAKDTDAPGWGQYEEMNDEDYGDVADAWGH